MSVKVRKCSRTGVPKSVVRRCTSCVCHRLARATSMAGLLLIFLCGAAHSVCADGIEDKKADLLLRVKVKRAIDLGARWIASHQERDGSFRLEENAQQGPFPQSRHRFGISALCFYTLADCGYGHEAPAVKKALGYLRKHYRSYFKGDPWPQASAYSLSLLVLGLHTLYVEPEHRHRRGARDRYGERKGDARNPCGYPAWARRMIDDILDWLMESQAAEGLFRYPGGFNSGTRPPPGDGGRPPSHFGDEDLSNTQYVLLALWAGSRCGYAIPLERLERIATRLLGWQERDGPRVDRVLDPEVRAESEGGAGAHRYAEPRAPGETPYAARDRARGFPYTPGAPISGSMTTAGLSSLLIVKAMLLERGALRADLRTKLGVGIWDAIAWLQHNYTLQANPGMGSMWQYYYLYGLERALVIAAKRMLGQHDWYREGASLLVEAQAPDGRWQPPGQLGQFGGGPGPGVSPFHTDVLDTCFALLFLKRATIVPQRPVLDDPRPVTPHK